MILFFFQAEDGIRDLYVTGVQTCALPIWNRVQPARSSQPRNTSRPARAHVWGRRGGTLVTPDARSRGYRAGIAAARRRTSDQGPDRRGCRMDRPELLPMHWDQPAGTATRSASVAP